MVRLAARRPAAVRHARARAPSWRRRSSTGPAPVRVAGAGHSFSAGAATDGTLISLDALAPRARRRRGHRPRPRRGRHPPAARSRASCTRAGWRCRTSATSTPSRSPARSPPARTAPARASRTCPARSTSVELILADGSERTLDGRRRAPARRARLRSARSGSIAAVTIRCVPAFRLRNIDRPEPLDEVLDDAPGARRRPRPLRVLDVPARRPRAHAHARAHRATRRGAPAAPGPTRATSCSTTTPSARSTSRPPLPAHDPAAEPLRLRGGLPARARRLVARASSPPSGSCASRRWSTRCRASTPSTAVRARPRDPRAPPGLVPDRAALQRRRRRPALTRARPRERLRRRARVPRDGLRAGVPRGRGRAVELGGRPHWGKRSFLSAAELAPRYPRWDAFQAARAELDPDGRFANAWVRDVLG